MWRLGGSWYGAEDDGGDERRVGEVYKEALRSPVVEEKKKKKVEEASRQLYINTTTTTTTSIKQHTQPATLATHNTLIQTSSF